MEALDASKRGLTNVPIGLAQNPDIFFQMKEALNQFCDQVPRWSSTTWRKSATDGPDV